MCFPATKTGYDRLTVAEAEFEFGQVCRQSHQGNDLVLVSLPGTP